MSNQQENKELNIFKSLFKGREDVFAIRWEQGLKSGYMPAYVYDPYRYKIHRINGGTFQNYPDKSFLRLNDEELTNHLKGKKCIGLYPLLQDNTSWFLAADFDKENWVEECKSFIAICNRKNVPAYLERSRSGKGGHVWIFFDAPYPAVKSRKIFLSLLVEAGVISTFDKLSAFDRLFPNQDYHSGKGLGNLIALPLNKSSLEEGNSCFIDPESLQAFPNQFSFLSEIQRVTTSHLDELFHLVNEEQKSADVFESKLTIRLSWRLELNRAGIPLLLLNYIREELNFTNTAFVIKSKMGKNTFGMERYFNAVEEAQSTVLLPKGFTGSYCGFAERIVSSLTLSMKEKRSQWSLICLIARLEHTRKTLSQHVLKKIWA